MDARTTRPYAHLHYGICRHCYGTGMVTRRNESRALCPECKGEGALP